MNVNRATFHKTISLRTRLLIAFILTVLLPVVVISLSSAMLGYQESQNQVAGRLDAIAILKRAEVDLWVSNLKILFTTLSTGHEVKEAAQRLPLQLLNKEAVYEHFEAFLRANSAFETLFILNLEGQVVISTHRAEEGNVYQAEAYFIQGQRKLHLTPPFYDEAVAHHMIILTQPLHGEQGQLVGVFGARINVDMLNQIMKRLVGLGETGETYLVMPNGTQLTPSRFKQGKVIVHTLGADRALTYHENGLAWYNDYRGVPVFGVYYWLPELEVALLAEQDQAEALAPFYQSVRLNGGVALVALLLAILASLLLTRNITSPLINLAQTASHVAKGDLTHRAEVVQQDEIGYLAQAFNHMAEQLQSLVGGLEERVAQYTHQLDITLALSKRLLSISKFDSLLTTLAQEIKTQLHYEQVNIFLLDEFRQVLVRHTPHEAQEISFSLDQQTRLEVQAVLQKQAVFLHHKTGTELALPIVWEERVIAVLHVLTSQTLDLTHTSITLLQAWSDLIASAMRNARLLEQLEQALAEAREIQTQYLEQAWKQDTLGVIYQHSRPQAPPLPDSWVRTVGQHLSPDKPATTTLEQDLWQTVVVPIMFRHIMIGSMQLHTRSDTLWKEEDTAIIEAIVDQFGQIAERLRLFENTRQQATNEQIIREITDKLRAAPNLNRLMEVAAMELGRHLAATHASIELGFEHKKGV